MSNGPVLCFGEIVWDAMPEGIFLGGAPLNVAYHLTRLGHECYPVSRIGNDFLGEETLRRLDSANVSKKLVQNDPKEQTGAVVISLDESGDASYTIRQPAAWDFIEGSPELMEMAASASALVYGSLATRSEANAALLEKLTGQIPVRLCDVNLRKPFDDPQNALRWASKATLIKLNDEELGKLVPGSSGGLEEGAASLSAKTGVETIIVTRGGEGALVYHEGRFHEKSAPKVDVADTVGAGDAFTACFLSHFLNGADVEEALAKALRLGAFVAGRNGAQPDYDPEKILG